LSLAYLIGLSSCLSTWAVLASSSAPPITARGDLIEDFGGLLLGVSSCVGFIVGASLLVGRAKTRIGALLASVFGAAMAFAACSSAVVFHIFANTESEQLVVVGDRVRLSSSLGPAMIPTLMLTGAFAGIVGALVGLTLARPALWAADRSTGSLETSSGRVLFGVGVWLFVPVTISTAFAAFAALVNPARSGLLLLSLISPLASAMATVAGLGLLLRRQRWIAAVKRGVVPGYRVRIGAPVDFAGLPALEAVPQQQDDGVLEELVSINEADPYRGGGQVALPIARVRRDG
jgi:hypothetical protein